MKINNFKLLIILLIIASCQTEFQHEDNTYPKLIIEKKLQSLYDETKWNYYAMLGGVQSNQNGASYVDTLCISCDISSSAYMEQDSILHIYFREMPFIQNGIEKYYSCHRVSIPDTYKFCNGKMIEATFGNVAVFDKADILFEEPLYNRKYNIEKLQNFPNIIRKYQNQLNPWLYIEAKRRKII